MIADWPCSACFLESRSVRLEAPRLLNRLSAGINVRSLWTSLWGAVVVVVAAAGVRVLVHFRAAPYFRLLFESVRKQIVNPFCSLVPSVVHSTNFIYVICKRAAVRPCWNRCIAGNSAHDTNICCRLVLRTYIPPSVRSSQHPSCVRCFRPFICPIIQTKMASARFHSMLLTDRGVFH